MGRQHRVALAALALCVSCGEDLVVDRNGDEPALIEPQPTGAAAPVVLDPLPVEPVEPPAPLLGPPYPVLLVHGFSGFSDLGPIGYFFGVEEDLTDRGDLVFAPALPPYDRSEDRAAVLAEVITDVLEQTGHEKLHLIGHSQGGVDSRMVLQDPSIAARVASLTTVSSPHRGTALADLAGAAPAGLLNPAGQLLAWLIGVTEGEPPDEASWLDDDEVAAAYDPSLAAATESLSTAVRQAWHDSHEDPASVPIFSVAGVSNLRSLHHDDCDDAVWSRSSRVDDVDPFLLGGGLYLNGTAGGSLFNPTPNDGLVTVESARLGTFLGCFPADHLDEMGQIADFIPGLVSGFDHKALYRRLVDNARTVE